MFNASQFYWRRKSEYLEYHNFYWEYINQTTSYGLYFHLLELSNEMTNSFTRRNTGGSVTRVVKIHNMGKT